MVFDVSDKKEIAEAIADMDEEIKSLQESKSLIDRLWSHDIHTFTEDEYHQLCETPMRYTNALGKMLEERLGYPYKERTADSFLLELQDDSELRIPTSRIHGVEIIMPYFHGDDWKNTNLQLQLYRESIEETKQKIEAINKNYFEGTLSKKIEFTSGRYYKRNILGKTVAVIDYFCKSIKGLNKKYKTILEDLEQVKAETTEKYRKHEEKVLSEYTLQTKRLEEYKNKLFMWTDTIRIYTKAYNYRAIAEFHKNIG